MIIKTIKQKHSFPKTDVRYWEQKVAFQTPASRTYSVQIQHANQRAWINLGTANKAQAAILARKLYEELRANGWDETMRRRRGVPAEKKVNVTICEYLDAVKARSAIFSKTIESYGAALRKIAADIHGVAETGEKKSSVSRAAWRDKVGSIKLRTLTTEKIENWRIDFIRRKGTDPVKEKSARVSANSFIGCARSLFGADVVARVRDIVELPDPYRPSTESRSRRCAFPATGATFDMAALLESARDELATSKPEQYKIFLWPRWRACA